MDVVVFIPPVPKCTTQLGITPETAFDWVTTTHMQSQSHQFHSPAPRKSNKSYRGGGLETTEDEPNFNRARCSTISKPQVVLRSVLSNIGLADSNSISILDFPTYLD